MPAKRKVVGLWPRFYATIRLLCHCLREHVYVILWEATTSTFFAVTSRGCELLHSIASDGAQRSYFYVVSRWANNNNTFFIVRERASKWWPRGIPKSKPVHVVLQGANNFIVIRERSDGKKYILHSYRKKPLQWAYFYVISQMAMTQSRVKACPSSRRRDDITFFDVARSSRTAGVQWQQFDHRETRGDATIKFFMLFIKGWQQ